MPRLPVRRYFRNNLRPDIVAGLTVAMIAIPQSMAYAAIAGVSPLYGLYTLIVAVIAGALFGSSHLLSTGPTNATAMATAGVLALFIGMPEYRDLIFALAITSGVIKLILGTLKLGGIVRFISNSVLTGFLVGAGVLIIINQLSSLFGTTRPAGANAAQSLSAFFSQLQQINVYIFLVGLSSMLLFWGLGRISKRIPAAMLAILFGSGLVALLGWNELGVTLLQDLESTRDAALRFYIPQVGLGDLDLLLTGGFAIALLSLVEAMSVSKAIALSTSTHIESSRELTGQGIASIVSGFFQGIPTSGSPSRSVVNLFSGAKTRLASVFCGIFVLGSVYLLRAWIGYIPIASLAGIVILSAVRIVNWRHLALTWNSRGISRLVLVVTFFATLLLPLQVAIYIGALLSILIYLYESSQLKVTYLHRRPDGNFIEQSLEDVLDEHKQIALVNIDGPLYFGAVEVLEQQMERVIAANTKVIILRLRHMQLLASSGVSVLEEEILKAQSKGINVFVCGILEEVDHILSNSGIEKLVGKENMFPASQVLLESTKSALKKAEMSLKPKPK